MMLEGEFDVLPGLLRMLVEDLTDNFFEFRIAFERVYCAEFGRSNIDWRGIIENIDLGGFIERIDGLDLWAVIQAQVRHFDLDTGFDQIG